MEEFIPLSVPNMKGNELKYVTETVNTEWVSTGGEYINIFEKNISEYVGAFGAAACQSGTSGLHLALKVVGVKQFDEVIVPTLTFIAAVNPVTYVNAVPVFMDCDDSLCIDPIKLEEFCKNECTFINGQLINNVSKKHISAIVIVHIFGNIADMDTIMRLASEYNLKVVEDATEALGSKIVSGKYKGKFAGTIGDIGVFSFNGNKIITTGGGGMIVSNNEEYLAKAKYLSTQAKDDMLYFVHNEIGYNYRMTNVQAALGVAQLEQLENFIRTKNDNYDYYKKLGTSLLPFREDIYSNKWFYSYMTSGEKDRDGLIQFLGENKIQARPIWHLINQLPPYKNCQSYKIEKAKYYQDRIVNLPCSTNLTKDNVERVVNMVKKYAKQ